MKVSEIKDRNVKNLVEAAFSFDCKVSLVKPSKDSLFVGYFGIKVSKKGERPVSVLDKLGNDSNVDLFAFFSNNIKDDKVHCSLSKDSVYFWIKGKFPKTKLTKEALSRHEGDGALKIKADKSFTKAGEIYFDENGECRDNIKPIWHHIYKYPKDKETVYANGNTYIYCVVETSGLTEHFWAVYEGQDVRSKSDTSLPVPDYLIKRLPENVKTNESLDRREEDELYHDVLNWFYDNFSAQNDISDQQWKDLANGVDKNAKIFTKMIEDLKMQNADDEVKDKMHEFLVDFADTEVN